MRPVFSLLLLAVLASFTAASQGNDGADCVQGAFSVDVINKYCRSADDLAAESNGMGMSCNTYLGQVTTDCWQKYVDARKIQLQFEGRDLNAEQRRRYDDATELLAKTQRVFDEADQAAEESKRTQDNRFKDALGFVRAVQSNGFQESTRSMIREAEAEARQTAQDPKKEPGATPGGADKLKIESARIGERSLPAKAEPEQVAAIARQYLAGGSPKDAERLARRIINTSPGSSQGPSLMAQSAMASGKAEDAEMWAQKALALNPKDKKAADVLAFARAELSALRLKKPVVGNFEQVRERDLAKGLATDAGAAHPPPGTAMAPPRELDPAQRVLSGLLRRGFEKMNLGDLPGGLEDVSLHLDSHPRDLYARLVRAEILLRLGKPEAALADIDQVLSEKPDDPQALRARAAALYELGRYDEALKAIERALQIEPASGIGHLTRAKILEKLGRPEEAIGEYRSAAQLDPALEPVADAALRRLGAAAPAKAPSKAVERGLLRGGLIVTSLSLILLGLIGGAVVVTRRARTSERAAAPRDRTLGRGDLVAGQYRIERELGRGGMGVVFEALDEKLNRSVALKQLQGDFRASAEDAARFLQEARLVAQLRHPNIAEIYAAVEDGGLYLVFELVKGRSLDQLIGSGMTPDQARGVVAHVCAALTAAHARKIVHRDLKPSNLMITDGGVIKVMDFGIAHQSSNGGTMTQTAASGTPPYMAPEQAMGSVSPASDLYALGVMAYELLAGTRPFDGPDYLGPKMRGEFSPVTSRRPGLPPQLDAFFASALAADPARRPRDAAAFAAAFSSCW